MGEERFVTILVIPDGDAETRTIRISRRRIRWLVRGAWVLLAAGFLFVVSWGYLALRAHEADRLEGEVARLLEEREQVALLAAELEELEAAYGRIRDLFGPGPSPADREIWLPAPGGPPRGSDPVEPAEEARPTSWPLTEAGFITQSLLEGEGRDHPGLDVAVPVGAYIRAAGAGAVVETGDDPIYGLFVVVDHGAGLRSLYAHASLILAEEGRRVRRNEVLGITGSTGRSTAPHLHFEILQDGEPMDPLEFVTPP